MSTEKETIFESFSREDTFEYAKKMAESAKPGEVYCLTGDLGVGKTVFAQGFGAGMGITEPMSSPTFTILQEYTEGRLPLYHYDVYRMGESMINGELPVEIEEELEETGFYEYVGGDGVALIEWAELIMDMIEGQRTEVIHITIEKDTEKGFDYRRIKVLR